MNTVRRDSDRVAFHGVKADMVKRQADAMNLPLLQKQVEDGNYRERFLEGLDELKRKGIAIVVFGDIDVQENRAWCESVCREAGLETHFPLWGTDQRELLMEFIGSGFKAVAVCVESSYFDRSSLGSLLDKGWLEGIDERRKAGSNLTYCGENGEYHSFVFDGPPFKAPVEFSKGECVHRSNHWLIDLV